MFYFTPSLQVHVKFVPLGVIGAIVPWNYPLHNVFNPLIATLMSGNALVLKVRGYGCMFDCTMPCRGLLQCESVHQLAN